MKKSYRSIVASFNFEVFTMVLEETMVMYSYSVAELTAMAEGKSGIYSAVCQAEIQQKMRWMHGVNWQVDTCRKYTSAYRALMLEKN